MAEYSLAELTAMCDACEAGGPCWACGIDEDMEEIKALLKSEG